MAQTPETHVPAFSASFLKRFQILRRLAEGGMGAVYLAREVQLDRDVAIKVMQSLGERDEARFKREGQIQALLQHPRILRLYDADIDANIPYLVCEYVTGGTLLNRIERVRSNLEFTLKTVRDVADALAYAHERGVIHRDVKPANIFLDARTGELKLADFGLARSLATTEQLTAAGVLLGTPDYMSPEQLSGEELGPASDQYSLGVVGYLLLTHTLPFRRADGVEAMLVRLKSDPPPLTGLQPALPEGTAQILMRTLSRKPADRFPSMVALRNAVDAHLAFLATDDRLGTIFDWKTSPSPPALAAGQSAQDTVVVGSPATADAGSPAARSTRLLRAGQTTEASKPWHILQWLVLMALGFGLANVGWLVLTRARPTRHVRHGGQIAPKTVELLRPYRGYGEMRLRVPNCPPTAIVTLNLKEPIHGKADGVGTFTFTGVPAGVTTPLLVTAGTEGLLLNYRMKTPTLSIVQQPLCILTVDSILVDFYCASGVPFQLDLIRLPRSRATGKLPELVHRLTIPPTKSPPYWYHLESSLQPNLESTSQYIVALVPEDGWGGIRLSEEHQKGVIPLRAEQRQRYISLLGYYFGAQGTKVSGEEKMLQAGMDPLVLMETRLRMSQPVPGVEPALFRVIPEVAEKPPDVQRFFLSACTQLRNRKIAAGLFDRLSAFNSWGVRWLALEAMASAHYTPAEPVIRENFTKLTQIVLEAQKSENTMELVKTAMRTVSYLRGTDNARFVQTLAQQWYSHQQLVDFPQLALALANCSSPELEPELRRWSLREKTDPTLAQVAESALNMMETAEYEARNISWDQLAP